MTTSQPADRAQQVAALRRLSAEGIVDRATILKKLQTRLGAVNGQLTADSLGATRQAVNNWGRGKTDPSLVNTCLLARQFGLRLALVPIEEE